MSLFLARWSRSAGSYEVGVLEKAFPILCRMRTSLDYEVSLREYSLGQGDILNYGPNDASHHYRFWIVLGLSIGLHLVFWTYRTYLDVSNQT